MSDFIRKCFLIAVVWVGDIGFAADPCTLMNSLYFEKALQVQSVEVRKVKVRQQCGLGNCWLQSGLTEAEYRLISLGHKPIQLSADYLLANILRTWFPEFVRNPKTEALGLDTGAEDWRFDELVRDYGLMPASTSHQMSGRTWERINREVLAEAEYFGEKYRAARTDVARESAMNEAMGWFKGYLSHNVTTTPERFEFDGRLWTPQEFAAAMGLRGEKPSYYTVDKALIATYSDHIAQYQAISRDEMLSLLIREIKNGRAVKGSIFWTNRLREGRPGMINYETGTPTRGGGDHAITIVGYVEKHGKIIGIKIQNSWGTKRGDSGFYYFDTNSFWKVFRSIVIYPA